MNCEYSIGAWVTWRLLNWLNTVINTKPMTSQITRFLKRLLFNLAPDSGTPLGPGTGSHAGMR
jgi:hypothetical protein